MSTRLLPVVLAVPCCVACSVSTTTNVEGVRFDGPDGSTLEDAIADVQPVDASLAVDSSARVDAPAAFDGSDANDATIDAMVDASKQKVATPVFDPPAGKYSAEQQVRIKTTTPGAEIYFAVEGEPFEAYQPYAAGGLNLDVNFVFRAYAVAPGFADSDIAKASYVFDFPQTAVAPVVSPAGGTFKTKQKVTLTTSQPNGSILYTTDGTTPSTIAKFNGTIGSSLSISTDTTLKVISFASGKNDSAVVTATFKFTQ